MMNTLRVFGLSLAVAVGSACGGGGGASTGGAEAAPRSHAGAGADIAANAIAAIEGAFGGMTPKVALMPLESEGAVAEAVGELLLEDVSAGLAGSKALVLLERKRLKQVLGEVALEQMLGSESTTLDLGKALGADVLLSATARKVGDDVTLNLSIVKQEDSSTVAVVTETVSYSEDLQALVADRAERMNVRSSKEVLAAFGEVRAGDYADAEKVFDPMSKDEGERRSVGLMGLAAISFRRGKIRDAGELCEVSLSLSEQPSYCWVVQGRIALNQGRNDDATGLFARALTDEVLMDWQRAEAAAALGNLKASTKEPQAALSLYDRALSLDPTNADALSGKARMVEEAGDLATAIALYERGLKADPEDPVLALLMREAQQKLAFEQDKARQEKIRATAASMVKSSQAADPPKSENGWKSEPLSVTLVGLDEKGIPPERLGETEFLEASLRTALDGLPGVQIVDRQLLGQVLEELQLGATAMSDEKTAIKVGRVVSAKVLLGGSIVRMDGESQVTLKLIETETTRVLGQVNDIFDSDARLSKVSRKISELLTTKVGTLFPPRGFVTKTKGKRLQIDVGSEMGVQEGDEFAVYAPKGTDELGRAKAVEVSGTTAWLELPAKKRVPKGARAERK